MKIVLALGGNALLQRGQHLTAENQLENIQKAAASIAEIARNNELVIVHGNGPQVGLLMEQNAAYEEISPSTTPYPMDVLGAETCGMVGYMLQQQLYNQDNYMGITTLVTQTVVSKDDTAFNDPTKFVGPVYTKERAEEIMCERPEFVFKPDGDYYRRVVPSPAPVNIMEIEQIKTLLQHQNVVIACGGGGVPVVFDGNNQLEGVECVIDKDSTAALLAGMIDADMFIILTDGCVYKDFGEPGQQAMKKVSPKKLAEFDFPAGSMGPKIDAVCQFVEQTGKQAAIGSLYELAGIIDGQSGTAIAGNYDLEYYQ